jgi:hypothetical protein
MNIPDERLIEFNGVDREAGQLRKGRVAGTKIIQMNLRPELLNCWITESASSSFSIRQLSVNSTSTGQYSKFRSFSACFKSLKDGLVGQLTRRDVHRHAQVNSLIAPFRHLANHIEHHPAAQRHNQPRLSA